MLKEKKKKTCVGPNQHLRENPEHVIAKHTFIDCSRPIKREDAKSSSFCLEENVYKDDGSSEHHQRENARPRAQRWFRKMFGRAESPSTAENARAKRSSISFSFLEHELR